ncbi:MAG: DNA mismatch repair protein MutS [Chitinophagaceae bacterium]|nr:DNA mismatch repair protein MutS [Chitinophagaceae bacterium]
MLVDKITLKDIGLFDTDESEGLISHLNFCKSNGGKEQLDQYLAHPLNSIEAIEKRQKAIVVFINEIDFVHEMKITNGTTLVIEKFFGTAFKPIPTQISYPGAYWYQYINGADYALLKYSLEHLILFYENLNNWLLVFENKNENPIVATLVQNIKKLVQHPSLANLNAQSTLANPQKLLTLAYFFRNHYKNNTLQLLQYFFELDAYYSMAMATKKFNFVFPTWIKSETPLLEVVSAIHPLVPNPVDNTISLSSQTNLFFLTGANMAGKSTFIKTLGIVIYLAHVGIGAPAKKVTLSLFDGLITNLTIADNIVKGESYFFNEVQRIKNTIEKIIDGKKYFVLIDELFKGTNIQDAMKCSTAVIEGLQYLRNSIFVISTHLYEISDGLKKYDNIQFSYFETEVRQKELVFHYQLKQGVSQDRLGYLILEREGVVDLLNNMTKNKY